MRRFIRIVAASLLGFVVIWIISRALEGTDGSAPLWQGRPDVPIVQADGFNGSQRFQLNAVVSTAVSTLRARHNALGDVIAAFRFEIGDMSRRNRHLVTLPASLFDTGVEPELLQHLLLLATDFDEVKRSANERAGDLDRVEMAIRHIRIALDEEGAGLSARSRGLRDLQRVELSTAVSSASLRREAALDELREYVQTGSAGDQECAEAAIAIFSTPLDAPCRIAGMNIARELDTILERAETHGVQLRLREIRQWFAHELSVRLELEGLRRLL